MAYPTTGTSQDDDWLRMAICQLHELAVEWKIVELEDRCIDHLRLFRSRNLMNFGFTKFKHICDTKPPGCPLWRLAVDQFAFSLKSKPMPNFQVQGILAHVSRAFTADVLLCLAQPGGPVDPRRVMGCAYHAHGSNAVCHIPNHQPNGGGYDWLARQWLNGQP